MAQPALVSGVTKDSEVTLTSEDFSNTEDRRGNLSSRYKDLLTLCRLDFLEIVFTAEYGPTVAKRLAKATRCSTNNQYERAWKKFQEWLETKEFPPIIASTIHGFLEDCFNETALSPRTILGYRSAIKLPLLKGFGLDLDDQCFGLLAKAQFIARPPVKKIVPQWSLQPVLDLLSSREFNNSTCSMENILSKTLFLTSLASGNRGSEIAAIQRDSIAFRGNNSSVILPVKPGFLFKNQRMNKAPPNIVIKPLLNGDTNLCPVKAIRAYIDRTSELAKGTALFVHPSTGNNLQRPSMSMFLSKLIQTACPGSLPRYHDVRKKAASLAWVRGVSPEEIVNAAFWVSSSTFITRYLNPESGNVSSCVALGSQSNTEAN